MPKLSDYDKQKAAAQRRADKLREKQNSPEYRAKQLEKQREAAQRQQQRQREKQQAQLADPEYRQAQLDKARLKQQTAKRKPTKPVDVEAQRAKQLAAAQRQQQRQRDKALAKAKTATPKPVKAIKSKGLKGRTRTAEEKRLESLLARIGCICCKNQGWYTEAMNSQEGQHFISMHHVDGRTKPWSHAKQLPLCQYHHDTTPPAGAPEELFPLHGTGRKLWEKVNGSQEALLQQVYHIVGEQRPWLQPHTEEEAELELLAD